MLNKEICRKCWKKEGRGWNSYCEYRAKVDYKVYCIVPAMSGGHGFLYIDIESDVPSTCYFYTEQLILGQELC